MKRKFLTALVTAAVLLLNCMPVAASQEFTTAGTAECDITCQMESTYTVTIPAEISMTYSPETGTASGTYQIGVKGGVIKSQMVKVQPVTLTNTLAKGTYGNYFTGTLKGENTGKTLSVTVNQLIIQWIPEGVTPMLPIMASECVEISYSDFVYSEGTITSAVPQVPDTYTGTLVFQFGLEECK